MFRIGLSVEYVKQIGCNILKNILNYFGMLYILRICLFDERDQFNIVLSGRTGQPYHHHVTPTTNLGPACMFTLE